jgi:hypothetical protein
MNLERIPPGKCVRVEDIIQWAIKITALRGDEAELHDVFDLFLSVMMAAAAETNKLQIESSLLWIIIYIKSICNLNGVGAPYLDFSRHCCEAAREIIIENPDCNWQYETLTKQEAIKRLEQLISEFNELLPEEKIKDDKARSKK